MTWTVPALITTSLSGFIFLFLAPLTFESVWQAGVAIFAQLRTIKDSTTKMAKRKAFMDMAQIVSVTAFITFFLSVAAPGSLLTGWKNMQKRNDKVH